MLPSNFKFSEYFNKKNPDQWNEVDFLSWLSNDELFAENRLLQDRWTRWHNYFHEALEAIISRCKDLVKDKADDEFIKIAMYSDCSQ
ncbi:hypothetical protein BC936DRAFT_144648 [Jimgerdemannia flammicorona]|uniref:Uncharacterized protein n=1 Tax=Jimgerdemannia flammicorona TaxID=994334 RepID=A0A433DM12_9FUNG|nr:hypothetical protein BC936DRAFT_144648 [Jimgerdemannia flammicorona]